MAPVDLFKKNANSYMNKLILFIIIVTIGITLITTILVKKLTKPIEKLTLIAREIARSKNEKNINIDINTNDEIGELAKAFKVMLKSLEKSKEEIEKFALNLEKEVEKKTEELQKMNENLQQLVEEKVNEVRDKEKLLLQQSKMAAMGEMIGAISHQWRQPLNSLALNIQLLEDLAESNELSKEEVENFVEKNMQTIEFMSQTIDDFRNFFRKDKEMTEFDVKEAIEKTISLQRAQLKDHNISVTLDLDTVYIKGYKNEFMQVILNIVANAKDAIEERRKKENIELEGYIFISAKKEGDKVVIRIKDNGGGIPETIKDRIFEPYFTTKEEGKGTGIGLYMVKEIIERMNGDIRVENSNNGAEFVMEFEKKG
jgi:signal transduction histidine kinase